MPKSSRLSWTLRPALARTRSTRPRPEPMARSRCEGCRRGEVAVSATSQSHLPSSTVIQLKSGESRTIEIRLADGGALLSGIVSDVTGGTVAGSVIAIVPMRGALGFRDREISGAISGADGSYALRLAPGRYRATASHPDYVSAGSSFDMPQGERTLNLSIAPGAVIEGVALSADDRSPVPGALVSYSVQSSDSLGPRGATGVAIAGGDGSFRITGLSAGLVQLTARSNALATRAVEVVPLGVAEQTSSIELLLDGAHRLSGRVIVSGSSKPAADVQVIARPSNRDGPSPQDVTTDEDGNFSFVGLAPGSYQLSTFGSQYFGDMLGTPVEITEQDLDDVVLEVRPGAMVRGKVSPAGRAQVQAFQERKTMQGALRLPVMGGFRDTGEDGHFEIGPLQPGSIEIEARDALGRRGTAAFDVPLEGLAGVVIELEDGSSVIGQVRDAKGNPVGDAIVRLRHGEGGQAGVTMVVNGRELTAFEGTTDKSGNYAVRGLQKGPYELTVSTEIRRAASLGQRKTRSDFARHCGPRREAPGPAG